MSAEVAAPGRSWFQEHRREVGYGVVGLLATLAGLVLVARTTPPACPQLHPAIQLAGSDDRLARLLGGCPDPAGFAASVGWDFLLLAGYGLLLTAVLRVTWERYYAPQLAPVKALVRWLPAIAAGLDAVENALVLALVSADPTTGALHYAGGVLGGGAVATAAWLKWFTLAATAVALVLGLVALGNGRRPVRAGRGRPWPFRDSALPPVQPEDGSCAPRIRAQLDPPALRGGEHRDRVLRRRHPGRRVHPRRAEGPRAPGPGRAARHASGRRGRRGVRRRVRRHGVDAGPGHLRARGEGHRGRGRAHLADRPHPGNALAAPPLPAQQPGRDVLQAVALIVTNLAGLASLIALLAWPVRRRAGPRGAAGRPVRVLRPGRPRPGGPAGHRLISTV